MNTQPQGTSHVRGLLASYARRMRQGLQLYAGTNHCSPAVQRTLSCGLGEMPAIGRPYAKAQPGTGEISALEELVEAQAMDMFGGRWAECRLASCTLANAAVYAAFSKPGDTIASIPARSGGHVSHHEDGTLALLARRGIDLPMRGGRYDDAAAGDLILRERPRIVVVGASVILEPYQLERTAAACQASGALLVYDASHVLGLIAGGLFQNPLHVGAHLMTASTYKSFGGPPGGLIVGTDAAQGQQLQASVGGPWSSNYDASRLAALSIALSEAREFMPAYAQAMLENAASLAHGLAERGVALVRLGESHRPQTHQVVVRCESPGHALDGMRAAESCGIYVGTCSVPGDPAAGGLRFGTQAVTRRGAGDRDMREMAHCVADLMQGMPPTDLAPRVAKIAARLDRLLYASVD